MAASRRSTSRSTPPSPYRRTLSAEDAETRSILITKDRWRHFPPPLEEFTVRVGRQSFVTNIVPEDCSCVLPPHQHMHLQAGHFADRLEFKPGSVVEINFGLNAILIRNG